MPFAEDFREHGVLTAKLLELWPGEPVKLTGARSPLELVQGVRIAHGKRLEDVRVEDREDGGVETEAERDGADDRQGERRRPAEAAHRVPHVLPQRVDEPDAARVAALVGDERGRSEPRSREASRLDI